MGAPSGCASSNCEDARHFSAECSVCSGVFHGSDRVQVVRAAFACIEACRGALRSTISPDAQGSKVRAG